MLSTEIEKLFVWYSFRGMTSYDKVRIMTPEHCLETRAINYKFRCADSSRHESRLMKGSFHCSYSVILSDDSVAINFVGDGRVTLVRKKKKKKKEKKKRKKETKKQTKNPPMYTHVCCVLSKH